MSGKIAALEAQLREKEQLVGALTERLEQAAEQLDRIHRTGGDRGLRIPGGGAGLPAELLEQQKALTDELQQAVQHWEDMQCAAALGRIEMQVGEIRDLLSGQALGGGTVAPMQPRPQPEPHHGGSGSILAKFGLGEADEGQTDEQDAQPAGWEAMKANLLGEEFSPPETSGDQSEASNAAGPVGGGDLQPVVLGAAPEAVDFNDASLEQLKEAVLQRDEFIADLIRKLRYVESQQRVYGNLSNIEGAPEEIRNRIAELETEFDEKRRLAEVENAVERARLSREAMRLHQLEEQLQKEIKRHGLQKGANGDDDDAPTEAAGKGGRWRRMLGIGNEDE